MGNNVDGHGCYKQSLRKMVEVFKTNVNCPEHANMLITQICKVFIDYRVNFDLDDCDNVMRVESLTEKTHAGMLINLLKESGFYAEVLPD